MITFAANAAPIDRSRRLHAGAAADRGDGEGFSARLSHPGRAARARAARLRGVGCDDGHDTARPPGSCRRSAPCGCRRVPTTRAACRETCGCARSICAQTHRASLPRRCCVVNVPPLLRELILAATEMPIAYDERGRDGRVMRLILDELRGAERSAAASPAARGPSPGAASAMRSFARRRIPARSRHGPTPPARARARSRGASARRPA